MNDRVFISTFNKRDWLINNNNYNHNKILGLKNIEIVGYLVVDDLSDFWMLKILQLIELIENLTKQKVIVLGDISKQRYSQNEKKEIYVKTIVRGYNLKEFIKYFNYIIVPLYIYKYYKLGSVKKGLNSMVITINNGNVLFGLSKNFIGTITLTFNFNLDKNLDKYLSFMGINNK